MSQEATKNNQVELDFTKELHARYTVLCDQCNKEIKSSNCCGSTSASVSWSEKKDDDSYPQYHSANLCDLTCLKAYVAKIVSE
jgi:hypothetical protein